MPSVPRGHSTAERADLTLNLDLRYPGRGSADEHETRRPDLPITARGGITLDRLALMRALDPSPYPGRAPTDEHETWRPNLPITARGGITLDRLALMRALDPSWYSGLGLANNHEAGCSDTFIAAGRQRVLDHHLGRMLWLDLSRPSVLNAGICGRNQADQRHS